MKNKKIKIGGNNLLLLITIVLFIIMYGIGCVVYDDKGFGHFQTFLNLLIKKEHFIMIYSINIAPININTLSCFIIG